MTVRQYVWWFVELAMKLFCDPASLREQEAHQRGDYIDL